MYSLCNLFLLNAVVHEAVSTENTQLLQEILEKRDFQRYSTRAIGIPDLLSKIQGVCFDIMLLHFYFLFL